MADLSSTESRTASGNQADNRVKRLRKHRRLGVVPISIEVMAQHLLTPRQGVKVEGLPIDAEFVTAFYSPETYGLNMVYGHESFDQVPEGERLPILYVAYTEYWTVGLSQQDTPKTVSQAKRGKNAAK